MRIIKILEQPKKIPLKIKKGFLVFSFGFLIINLFFHTYMVDRIYPGITLGKLSLGGMNRQQVENLLLSKAAQYKLNLKIGGASYLVTPQAIGLSYDYVDTFDTAYQTSRESLNYITGLAGMQEPVTYQFNQNQEKFNQFVDKIIADNSKPPVNAAISIQNGKPTVIPDQPGRTIEKTKIIEAVQIATSNQVSSISILPSTVPAPIQANDLTPKLTTANKLLATRISLTYQNQVFSPSSAEIGNWLVFPVDKTTTLASIDESKVKAYIDTAVAPSINIDPKNKDVTMQNGQIVSQTEGKNGLAVASSSLAHNLAGALLASTGAISLTIPTVEVPYKTTTNNSVSLEGVNKYIEINLSSQHLWAYQDHQVLYSSPLTSGAAKWGFGTATGLFSIYNKQRNTWLNGYPLGYNYNVFVQYWMPFYQGYGLHDASWRNGVFGGPDYYYNGSHGCVNLPLATAAWLYDWSDIGTPVWIHN